MHQSKPVQSHSLAELSLFYKLLKDLSISGKFLRILQQIYIDHNVFIKTSDGLLEPFATTTGVKQGCIFSPLLYNLYSNNLDQIFDDSCDHVVINNKTFQGSCDPVEINNKKLNCLSWADDLLLMSTTKRGLQEAMNRTSEYYLAHGLTINNKKTMVM